MYSILRSSGELLRHIRVYSYLLQSLEQSVMIMILIMIIQIAVQNNVGQTIISDLMNAFAVLTAGLY